MSGGVAGDDKLYLEPNPVFAAALAECCTSLALAQEIDEEDLNSICTMHRLRKLALSRIVAMLPQSISALVKLQDLDVVFSVPYGRSDVYADIPAEIACLTHLTRLTVQRGQSLNEVCSISSLQELRLHCHDERMILPQNVSALTRLTLLELSDSRVIDVGTLAWLSSLVDLHCEDVDILAEEHAAFCNAISSLLHLTRLVVTSLSCEDSWDGVAPLEVQGMTRLTALRVLILDDMNLEECRIPAALSGLQELALRDNRLTWPPENLHLLTALSSLDLSMQKFGQFQLTESLEFLTRMSALSMVNLQQINQAGDAWSMDSVVILAAAQRLLKEAGNDITLIW